MNSHLRDSKTERPHVAAKVDFQVFGMGGLAFFEQVLEMDDGTFFRSLLCCKTRCPVFVSLRSIETSPSARAYCRVLKQNN